MSDVFTRLYHDLHRIAVGLMSRQGKDHTLQATALLHEAYLRLRGRVEEGDGFRDDREFLVAAARAMRWVLVDAARRPGSRAKRANRNRVPIEELAMRFEEEIGPLLDLDDALDRLHTQDPRLAQVAELKIFTGLEMAAIAEVLGRPLRTVEDHWRLAKSCLISTLR